MFHFPTFPPPALCVQAGVTGHDSSRVSPFGNPRITVRLPTPRGLSQAPTSFFGSWCQGIHRAPLLTWPQRCSRPLCSSQATGGYRSKPAAYSRGWSRSAQIGPFHTRAPATEQLVTSAAVGTRETSSRSLPQDPTACRDGTTHSVAFHSPKGCTHDGCAAHRQLVNVPPMSNHRGTLCPRSGSGCPAEAEHQMLLRKEVIQPHLPVRLPCYDFVPIASPTFDSSLPCGLGHRLRVLPTFVT
jgi:hypothetical protein